MLSLLITSYRRPDALIACLNQFRATTTGQRVEYVLVLDPDPETFERARDWLYSFAWPDFTLILNDTRQGALACWNRAGSVARGELLYAVGDDQWPHEGWLEQGLAAHKELGDYGLVAFNDKIHAPPTDKHDEPIVYATPMYDRAYCRAVLGGAICVPWYSYLCVDLEITARARRDGHCIWLKEAIVEHLHPSAGKRAADAQDAEHTSLSEADNALFRAREAAGFPDDFASVVL